MCQSLRDDADVEAADVIAGDFDVMIARTGEEPRDILETVTESVRPLEGVGATRTYVCVD